MIIDVKDIFYVDRYYGDRGTQFAYDSSDDQDMRDADASTPHIYLAYKLRIDIDDEPSTDSRGQYFNMKLYWRGIDTKARNAPNTHWHTNDIPSRGHSNIYNGIYIPSSTPGPIVFSTHVCHDEWNSVAYTNTNKVHTAAEGIDKNRNPIWRNYESWLYKIPLDANNDPLYKMSDANIVSEFRVVMRDALQGIAAYSPTMIAPEIASLFYGKNGNTVIEDYNGLGISSTFSSYVQLKIYLDEFDQNTGEYIGPPFLSYGNYTGLNQVDKWLTSTVDALAGTHGVPQLPPNGTNYDKAALVHSNGNKTYPATNNVISYPGTLIAIDIFNDISWNQLLKYRPGANCLLIDGQLVSWKSHDREAGTARIRKNDNWDDIIWNVYNPVSVANDSDGIIRRSNQWQSMYRIGED